MSETGPNGRPAPLVFLHVPKTGGMGVEAQLDEWLGEPAQQGCYPWWGSTVVATRPGRVVGHFPYEMLTELAPPGAAWLTVLRDPVERSISHWWHHTRTPGDAPWPDDFRRGVTLERWCSDPLFSYDSSDAQVRYLAWLPEGDRAAILAHRPIGPVPDEAVALALERLGKFAWVGVTERHHQGLQLLAYTIRQAPPTRRPPLNEGTGRPRPADIPGEVRQMLAERNRGDAAVHQLAQRLFADRYQDMVDDLLTDHPHAPAPSSFELDLTRPVADRAWHGLEQAGETTFRWIGDRITFDALIDRSVPRTLDVEIVAWVDDRAVERATIAVDGQPVPIRKVEGGTVLLRAGVETRPAWWVQRTRIDIQPGAVATTPSDPRLLGLAIAAVRIS